MLDKLLDDTDWCTVEIIERPRSGWLVRVVGDGSDKGHYKITRVRESPGSESEFVTTKNGARFKRNGARIWKYRQEARNQKNSEQKWRSNRGSWSRLSNEDYYYG